MRGGTSCSGQRESRAWPSVRGSTSLKEEADSFLSALVADSPPSATSPPLPSRSDWACRNVSRSCSALSSFLRFQHGCTGKARAASSPDSDSRLTRRIACSPRLSALQPPPLTRRPRLRCRTLNPPHLHLPTALLLALLPRPKRHLCLLPPSTRRRLPREFVGRFDAQEGQRVGREALDCIVDCGAGTGGRREELVRHPSSSSPRFQAYLGICRQARPRPSARPPPSPPLVLAPLRTPDLLARSHARLHAIDLAGRGQQSA